VLIILYGFQTTAIISSLLKSKEAVQNLPQAAFKEVDSYNIPCAPPMPNSYIRKTFFFKYTLFNL